MIELDQLIDFYRERLSEHPPISSLKWDDVVTSTITYLVAFKQVHEMLKRLAEAIEGVNPEGD